MKEGVGEGGRKGGRERSQGCEIVYTKPSHFNVHL